MFTGIFWLVIAVNYLFINYCVFVSRGLDDVSFYFQERQAITFLSAVQLALTSLLAIVIYTIGKVVYKKDTASLKQLGVWAVSAFVFLLCTFDEYFMLHEGIDGDIATIFFGTTANPHMDGLTLGLYLVAAIFVFLKFKDEVLRHKNAFILFCAGAFFFLVSISLDVKASSNFRIVLEESAKLTAVAFLFLGHVSVFMDYKDKLDEITDGR